MFAENIDTGTYAWVMPLGLVRAPAVFRLFSSKVGGQYGFSSDTTKFTANDLYMDQYFVVTVQLARHRVYVLCLRYFLMLKLPTKRSINRISVTTRQGSIQYHFKISIIMFIINLAVVFLCKCCSCWS